MLLPDPLFSDDVPEPEPGIEPKLIVLLRLLLELFGAFTLREQMVNKQENKKKKSPKTYHDLGGSSLIENDSRFKA